MCNNLVETACLQTATGSKRLTVILCSDKLIANSVSAGRVLNVLPRYE